MCNQIRIIICENFYKMIGKEKTLIYISSNINLGLKSIAEKVISKQRITEKKVLTYLKKGILVFRKLSQLYQN